MLTHKCWTCRLNLYTAYARFFNNHFSLMSLSTCDDWIKKNLVMPAPNFKNSDLTSELYSSILSLKYQYVLILWLKGLNWMFIFLKCYWKLNDEKSIRNIFGLPTLKISTKILICNNGCFDTGTLINKKIFIDSFFSYYLIPEKL